MTLDRSNPGPGHAVIDRNDDSLPVRLAAIGGHGIFLGVLIEALRALGVDAWRVDPGTRWEPGDGLRFRTADLVLLDVSVDGYTENARALIRRLAREGMLAVVLDGEASPEPGRLTVEAGTLWAVNPRSVAIEDLAAVLRQAAARRRAAEHQRHRAHRARQAWDEATHDESSILTMRLDGDRSEDVADRNRRRPHVGSVGPSGATGGEQGRQG